jgi:DNA/RNA endonuclease G (NUC1)
MPETQRPPSAAGQDAPEGARTVPAILIELREAHVRLLQAGRPERKRASGAGRPALDIKSFADHLKASGAALEHKADRRAAQDMLDYWTAQIMASSADGAEPADLATLDPYRPPMAQAESAATPSPNEPVAASIPAPQDTGSTSVGAPQAPVAVPELNKDIAKARQESREQVRLAALARQWRNSGRVSGYCLTGQALLAAAPLASSDPEIAEFIAASNDYDRHARRFRTALWTAIVLSLAFAVLALGLALVQSRQAARVSEDARAREHQLNEELNAAAQKLRVERDTALERLGQHETVQAQLDLALDALRRMIAARSITIEDVPSALRAQVQPPTDEANLAAEKQAAAQFEAHGPEAARSGYNGDFLDTRLPLPRLARVFAAEAFADGRPLDYANYSLIFNVARKMAFVTASNVSRSGLLLLPRSQDIVVLDPRVPPALQLNQGVFADNDLDIGHLVTRQEVTWGPYFVDTADAARRAAANVNVFTNITTQYDTFNRGIWSQLERWVLTTHNRSADRIIVFSGPVFAPGDPVVGTVQGQPVRAPRAFWKIAASLGDTAPGAAVTDAKAQQIGATASRPLVIDAFLIPQLSGTGDKLGRTRFEPDLYRVTVTSIEQLTGLVFDPQLHSATDREAAALAAAVPQLDAPVTTDRTTTIQRLVTALRDNGLPVPEQLLVLETLAGMLTPDAFAGLSQAGRYNLMFLLSEVPAANWARPGWASLTDHLRTLAEDIAKSSIGRTLGPKAGVFLAQWQQRMTLLAPSDPAGVPQQSPAPPAAPRRRSGLLRRRSSQTSRVVVQTL